MVPYWGRHCKSFFAYQSVLSIQSDSIRSSKINPLGSKKFFLYNGEIYGLNKNKELSDTEYLFKKWEEGVLEKTLKTADGMYALCTIKQFKNSEVILDIFRDIMGEKHCWYYFNENIFMVSSVPAIIRKYISLEKNIEIDKSVLEDYLLRRHLISPKKHCIKGIYQLLPGQKISFNSNSWTIKEEKVSDFSSFFDIKQFSFLEKLNQNEYNEMFNEIFKKIIFSMEKESKSSKTSAAIISGGIDSSIVAAELINKTKTRDLFTMIFLDKDPVAKNVPNLIKNLNINNELLNIIKCDLQSYQKSLIDSIDILSSPINTHSMPSASLVAQLARNFGNSIIYGGEGADEIFLGYGAYLKDIQSPYNSIQNNFTKFPNLHRRVSEGDIQIYINSFRLKVEELLKNHFPQENKDLKVKIESFADTFIQLNSVGLLSTDSVNSNLGIECRTPFTRKEIVKFGLSTPTKKLINKKNRLTKIPLTNLFKNYYYKNSLMPKMGFAGFPNETQKFLGETSNWMVWDYFGFLKSEFDKMSIAESWKIINIEWFLRICLK